MIATTLAQVAATTGARLAGADPGARVSADVEVDSRRVAPGGLFVALPGERTDGHDHVPAAVAAGAVAALTARPVPGSPCLVVPDPLAALQALAADTFARDQPRTFGITGSSGKTSTKDLLAHLLGDDVLAPVGSFNNELGLPLTLLRRTERTRAAVLEYSARGVGHIAFLAGLARPHVSLVLNVGSAHLGEFGSVEAIARAKGELVEAVTAYGDEPPVVVLNADDPRVLAMSERAPAGSRVVLVGLSPQAQVRADDVQLDGGGRASFVLRTPAGDARVQLGLVGEHAVANALSAAAAALLVHDLETVAARLATARPVSRWRMEVVERPDGVTVVNDAYNANPDSMRAALKTLKVMGDRGERRTVAVLGQMAELGEGARDAHMDLGRFVVRLDVGQLVVVGPEAGGIHAGAVLEGSWGSESIHVDDVDAAVALLRGELAPGDVVLVKASRSAGLERVAAALLDGAGG
ncbi:MAG TPA: UDP-N-acetylmuramoyl-tripeptide--D-alanyl-D-alanine ligase [Mycobacteriales bacterium]|nr:UDP-N-acetylmuramoyl-tripeptide--D-alanyl-D-alanine ligase [Mycobacteriales bacterium]